MLNVKRMSTQKILRSLIGKGRWLEHEIMPVRNSIVLVLSE